MGTSLNAKDYTNNLLNALYVYRNNNKGYGIYNDAEGSLRLAREYGYGLKDFSMKERKEMLEHSYINLYIKFYNLKPFIDAKDWIQEITKIIK